MVCEGFGFLIVIFGDGGMVQIGFFNWFKVGLFNFDFVFVCKVQKLGVLCWFLYVQENYGFIKFVDGFFVFGKDEKGNYWMLVYKVKGQWDKLDEYFVKEYEKGV